MSSFAQSNSGVPGTPPRPTYQGSYHDASAFGLDSSSGGGTFFSSGAFPITTYASTGDAGHLERTPHKTPDRFIPDRSALSAEASYQYLVSSPPAYSSSPAAVGVNALDGSIGDDVQLTGAATFFGMQPHDGNRTPIRGATSGLTPFVEDPYASHLRKSLINPAAAASRMSTGRSVGSTGGRCSRQHTPPYQPVVEGGGGATPHGDVTARVDLSQDLGDDDVDENQRRASVAVGRRYVPPFSAYRSPERVETDRVSRRVNLEVSALEEPGTPDEANGQSPSAAAEAGRLPTSVPSATFNISSPPLTPPHNVTFNNNSILDNSRQSITGRMTSAGRHSASRMSSGVSQPSTPPPTEFDHDKEQNQYDQLPSIVYQQNRQRGFMSRSFRIIPQTPERILDAPDLLDDFYLNLIDWSALNVLAVALSKMLYLWNAETGQIYQLTPPPTAGENGRLSQPPAHLITSVAFHTEGIQLAVGNDQSTVQLWDTQVQKCTQTFHGHRSRVASLAWNGPVLASASRDATIRLYDIRCPSVGSSSENADGSASGCVATIVQGHTQEVCGLRWNPNGNQLASGGNDNLLNIWDFHMTGSVSGASSGGSGRMQCRPLYQLKKHTAAIKALSWNPVRSNLLCSGGGTADKYLYFWDTTTGECVNGVDTGSQICGVLWNKEGTELVSSHGYSENQLSLWRYPSLKRVTELTGHTSRVLHLAMSPDGETVVSAAGDETIRFWKCFGPAPSFVPPSGNAAAQLGSPVMPSPAGASSPWMTSVQVGATASMSVQHSTMRTSTGARTSMRGAPASPSTRGSQAATVGHTEFDSPLR